MVPRTSIDMEAHWPKSGWHGRIYGWLQLEVASVAVGPPMGAQPGVPDLTRFGRHPEARGREIPEGCTDESDTSMDSVQSVRCPQTFP
jgi:hypothetical protein